MRRLLFICAAALLLAATSAQAQDAYQQLADLLDRGLYNTAALVAGPALVEASPEDPRAFELYARALLLSGDVTAARDAFDTMLRLTASELPESASGLHLAGLLLAAEGESAQAAGLLEQAFRQSGSYQQAMDWGRIAWQAGDPQQAEEAYRSATETEQGAREPWPWLDLGRLLLFQDRLDEAEEYLEQAIAVYEAFDTGVNLPSPAYVEAFYRLGQLAEKRHAASGENALLQNAINNYRNALVGDPNYAPAQTALQRLTATQP